MAAKLTPVPSKLHKHAKKEADNHLYLNIYTATTTMNVFCAIFHQVCRIQLSLLFLNKLNVSSHFELRIAISETNSEYFGTRESG